MRRKKKTGKEWRGIGWRAVEEDTNWDSGKETGMAAGRQW